MMVLVLSYVLYLTFLFIKLFLLLHGIVCRIMETFVVSLYIGNIGMIVIWCNP